MTTPPPVTPNEPALFNTQAYTFSPDVEALLNGEIDTSGVISQSQVDNHFSIMNYSMLVGLPRLAFSQMRAIIDKADPQRSKYLYTDIAQSALSLNKARSIVYNLYPQWSNVIDTINQQVPPQNAAITQFNNTQQANDQAAIDAVNQAISNYNAGLIDATALNSAITAYNNFVTARSTPPSAYTDYQTTADAFNAEVANNNATLTKVNQLLSKLGQPTIPLEQDVPSAATLTPITLPIPLPPPGSLNIPAIPPEPQLALLPTYTPPPVTKSQFIKQITNLYQNGDNSMLNAWNFTSDLYDNKQAYLKRTTYFLQGSQPLPTQIPSYIHPKTNVASQGGESVGMGSELTGKQSSSTEVRLEVSTAAYTSFTNKLQFTYPDYATNADLNMDHAYRLLLATTALSAAAYTKDANLPTGSDAERITNAAEFVNGVNELSQGNFISNLLSENGVPQEALNDVSSALNVALNQFAVFQASVALNAPGLYTQVLANVAPEIASSLAPLSDGELFGQTLQDSQAISNLAAFLSLSLTNSSTFTSAQSEAIVRQALNNFFLNPQASVNTFPQILSTQLVQQGVSSDLAQQLSQQAVSAVLNQTPVNHLSATDLNLNPDLGAININSLLAPTTVQRYVQGISDQKRDSSIEQVDFGSLSTHIKQLLNQGEFDQLRDVRNAIANESYNQGLNLNDAVTFSNRIAEQIKNEVAYSDARTSDVINSSILQQSLAESLNANNIVQSDAVSQSVAADNLTSANNSAAATTAANNGTAASVADNAKSDIQQANINASQLKAQQIAGDLLKQNILFGSELTFRNALRDAIARATGADLTSANNIAQTINIGLQRSDSAQLSDLGVTEQLSQERLANAVYDRIYNQLSKNTDVETAQQIAQKMASNLIGPAASYPQSSLAVEQIRNPTSAYNNLQANIEQKRSQQNSDWLQRITDDFRGSQSVNVDAFVFFQRVMDPGTHLLHSSATGVMYKNDNPRYDKASIDIPA